ncbi:major histocompatibility complex class I-related gene protein-like isoform X2 [Archocentrus centrarchus]|uniref:major histocompatibility complex class I-related gene protein-like isoform X2 n=1 Tax=Archocentrus centrarchus TaxID=63155 RepID=UPI0011EA0565|nr:major histocompatibility complex class I-related gene protein-like isoform X2 [Archocentrus centrarchus]
MRIGWLCSCCLCFSLVSSAMKHSLQYLVTASSGVLNIPEFMGVMLLDGIQMAYCDSNNRILELRQDWVKKILENNTQLFEMYTRHCFVIQPSTFGARMSSLKEQFQQSGGVHILQMIEGCEWDENTGEATGILRYGYDGEDLVEFDLKTLMWTAVKAEAEVTKQKWDTDKRRTQNNENLLKNMYPKWLKLYLSYGNSSLQRTVLPSVSLLQKSPSSPISCHATGFYPHRAMMFWRKDGEEIHEGVDPGEILPNNDGTVQMSVDLNVSSVTPADWSRYECVFQLSEDAIITKLDTKVIRTNWGKTQIKTHRSRVPVSERQSGHQSVTGLTLIDHH